MFDEQNNTDAEKFKKEVIIVFTQSEFHVTSGTENFPNHNYLSPPGYFDYAEILAHEPSRHYSSLKFDNDDEFSAENETLQVNYASSDYFSSYSATLQRKDPSALMPKLNGGPMSTYPTPHIVWHSHKK